MGEVALVLSKLQPLLHAVAGQPTLHSVLRHPQKPN